MNNKMKSFLSLAMIISTVASATVPVFAENIEPMSPWAYEEYEEASQNGLLTYDLVKSNLTDFITEKEFEDLLKQFKSELEVKTDEIEVVKEAKKEQIQESENLSPKPTLKPIVKKDGETPEYFKSLEFTREKMIDMLIKELVPLSKNLKAAKDTIILEAYVDGKNVQEDYKIAFATALENNLLSGFSEGDVQELKPESKATKEQAITILNNAYELVMSEREKYMIGIPVTLTGGESEKKSIINIEVNNKGEITLSDVEEVEFYNLIVKDSNNELFYEKSFDSIQDLVIDKELEKDSAYTVIVGVKLFNDEEQYSLPFTFEYKGNIGEQIVEEVKKYLGVNYVWGGTTPRGFDCSGLTQYVCNAVGVSIKRVADDQWKHSGTYVTKSELEPGDLVYFGYGNNATHVGVYVGDGQMIHAPHTGDVVRYADINNSYFKSRFLGGKRVS